jgi:hypothetical protein
MPSGGETDAGRFEIISTSVSRLTKPANPGIGIAEEPAPLTHHQSPVTYHFVKMRG